MLQKWVFFFFAGYIILQMNNSIWTLYNVNSTGAWEIFMGWGGLKEWWGKQYPSINPQSAHVLSCSPAMATNVTLSWPKLNK